MRKISSIDSADLFKFWKRFKLLAFWGDDSNSIYIPKIEKELSRRGISLSEKGMDSLSYDIISRELLLYNAKFASEFKEDMLAHSEMGEFMDQFRIEPVLDDNLHLIVKKLNMDISRVAQLVIEGISMINSGIFPGDKVLLERSHTAKSGDLIHAYINGHSFIKKYEEKDGKIFLISSNPKYGSYEVKDSDDFYITGIVKYILSDVE